MTYSVKITSIKVVPVLKARRLLLAQKITICLFFDRSVFFPRRTPRGGLPGPQCRRPQCFRQKKKVRDTSSLPRHFPDRVHPPRSADSFFRAGAPGAAALPVVGTGGWALLLLTHHMGKFPPVGRARSLPSLPKAKLAVNKRPGLHAANQGRL